VFHWRHGARERYFSATRCERFRCVHHEIPVGRNKAAGKFYEGNSVSPTFCGQNAREDVLSEFLREKYARAREGNGQTKCELAVARAAGISRCLTRRTLRASTEQLSPKRHQTEQAQR